VFGLDRGRSFKVIKQHFRKLLLVWLLRRGRRNRNQRARSQTAPRARLKFMPGTLWIASPIDEIW